MTGQRWWQYQDIWLAFVIVAGIVTCGWSPHCNPQACKAAIWSVEAGEE